MIVSHVTPRSRLEAWISRRRGRPFTVVQAAQGLGYSPISVNYHLRAMVAAGAIHRLERVAEGKRPWLYGQYLDLRGLRP